MVDLAKPHTLIGQTFDCPCGRSHTIATKPCLYEPDALTRLPDILAQHTTGRAAALFVDQRTFTAAGRRVESILRDASWNVNTIIVADTPICDDITYEKLTADLAPADIFLAVGAGVISDLTKWISFDRQRPYVAVPTAASMNGYASSNVSPALKGVKSITFAHIPVAIVTEPAIIADAPFELTASGLGDVIAKPISTADWLMNHLLFGEYFCPAISQMIATIEPHYFDHPDRVRDRHPQAIKALYDALIYSGFAMTMVGASAPASGGEHMLSHTFDMMAAVDGAGHDLHGRQVGLGTIFAAALYDELYQMPEPCPVDMPAGIDESFWGRLSDAVAEQYLAKGPLIEVMRRKLPKPLSWRELMAALRPHVRPAAEIKECLKEAGAAHCVADINCSRERFRAAVLHMHEIRKRPTVVDLAWLLGVLPDRADELIDRWLIE